MFLFSLVGYIVMQIFFFFLMTKNAHENENIVEWLDIDLAQKY